MAGFQVHKLQNEGDVMTKSDDFQKRNLCSVGRILGTDFKEMVEKIGGRYDKN